MMNNVPSLQIKELAFAYPDGNQALFGVNLSINKGERVALLGPNGAGKTSFFNLLSGIRKPSRGQIFVGETDVTDLPPHERALSGIARTFQTSSVFINLTCLENVRIAAQAANGKSMNLTKNAYKFPEVVASAAQRLEPHDIANYLRELAAAFHGLYNAHKLIDEDNKNQSLGRISLAEATRQVIANGLDLLGVSAPESM